MYTKAETLDEAVRAEGELRAGGTDLQERLRSRVSSLPVVDIGRIPGLDALEIADDGATIGALATLARVGADETLQMRYPALALPAQILATPQIRTMATMGGVLCQRTRCWYYRHPELGCPKKGTASSCPARAGNHHFGVVFDLGDCVHPHPSSIGCALLTYDAEISVTGRGRMSVADLYGDGSDSTRDHTLSDHEMITHVHLPAPVQGERAAYHRQMSRKWAEWPLVEVVCRLIVADDSIELARVAIGGVATIPLRLTEVEEALVGRPAVEATLAVAARRSTASAAPLPQTAYKLPMVEGSVLEALEAAVADGSGRLPIAV